MALLWIDGFDNYGTSVGSAPSPAGIMARTYPTVANESAFCVRAGRLSGYAIDMPVNATLYFRQNGLTTNATLVVGFALQLSVLSNDLEFFALYDGTTKGINLSILPTGEIRIRCGTTILATSSGAGITVNSWYFLELKVLCDDTVGTYKLRVGGHNVCSGTGADTKAGTNAYHDGFQFIGSTGMASVIVDDLYVLDASGAANNDFLGNMRVVTIRPDAAGDVTEFTPDSGANYARVNEAICGDDSNYVEDDTVDEKDLYNYGALGGVLATVAGIVVTTDCRETDATNFDLKTPCKSGATESDDAGQAIGSTNYVSRRRLMETDPNTGVAWTPTNLEAAQFGVKVG
jgi:hypothetical protein